MTYWANCRICDERFAKKADCTWHGSLTCSRRCYLERKKRLKQRPGEHAIASENPETELDEAICDLEILLRKQLPKDCTGIYPVDDSPEAEKAARAKCGDTQQVSGSSPGGIRTYSRQVIGRGIEVFSQR